MGMLHSFGLRWGLALWSALLLVLYAWQPIFWQNAGMAWMTVVVTFVLIPLADALIGAPRSALPTVPDVAARWLPRAQVPLQITLLLWASAQAPHLSTGDLLALSVAVGTVTGGLGITLAHEMGHRASRLDRACARVLLCMVGYGQFQVEHIRGHHVRVATAADPASAPRGMGVWHFVLRSVAGTWRHAWTLEAMRLRHRGLGALHWRNEVLTSNLLSLVLLGALVAGFGVQAGVLWVVQAICAAFLLESVNYVEHYGLRRAPAAAGYERVQPAHSWNADWALSNALLFNLQRHSDHHARMNQPWQALVTRDDAPQLPAGYPAMLPLAWVPPLWRRVMDARLDRWQRERAAAESLQPAGQ